ncbi:Bifunctional transcriptional activator/DNA repair enzyme AdaA [Paenibacillus polymyxa E681]|uniref:AraC family transcriptional regulator n=1 Tax=Paenibacillus polymyxa TaxID=1406 RepID=UPI0001E310DA|nr:AraC family transcriptional regulator [Paenibacillus polymyxa]ADM68261.1 AraC family transcriptional regulator [Paenibacillus polymyxa E681]QNV55258.1 Bifunctional transcriptional activator/DNA repair enzyme AdaA [Paenibacillus polymyxa E681]QNV60094.1 Bifunctional transcriptional activator/DNA repair enzyme AdaA [Paenibacillus polymyxa E681]
MTTDQKNNVGLWNGDPVVIVRTPSAFAKQSLLYIQELGYFQQTSAFTMERKELASFLLVFTLSGKGELLYRDKKYILKPQDLFFINCEEYVQYSTSGHESWEYISLYLYGNLIENFYEQFAKHNKPVISMHNPYIILDKLHALICGQSDRSLSAELLTSRLIGEILTCILQHPYDHTHVNAETLSEVRRVQQYLDQSYCERITLDSLAEMFELNKFNLAKNFKKQIGFSPIDYLINVRITAAQSWLKTSDMSIVDIARYVGIPNTSHFINLFKEHVGETPHSFRKKWGNRSKL